MGPRDLDLVVRRQPLQMQDQLFDLRQEYIDARMITMSSVRPLILAIRRIQVADPGSGSDRASGSV